MRIFIYNRLGNKLMKPKILLIGLALAIAATIGLYLLMNARCYQLLGNLVCHGADERKRIALTFDDAPSERTSDAVLAVLAEKNVKATFFMIGENIERYPQAAQRIAAAGHEMGNHCRRTRPSPQRGHHPTAPVLCRSLPRRTRSTTAYH